MSMVREARMLALRHDVAALSYLADGHTTATHHVARHLGFDRTAGTEGTSKARRVLKRLEQRQLVKGVSAPSGGNVFWYKITDTGREFLKGVKL